MQDGNDALLETVDKNLLDCANVLQNPGHHVTGGAIIKPAHRQSLDMRIKIVPKIKNDVLLKSGVEKQPKIIQSAVKQHGDRHDSNQKD